MSERTDEAYFKDMVEAAQRAVTFSSGMEYNDFSKDLRTQDAVIRNIEVIGEAAKNISEEYRKKIPGIPWKQITGMRDRLIHHYFGVNIDIVCDVVKNDLSQLLNTTADPKSPH